MVIDDANAESERIANTRSDAGAEMTPNQLAEARQYGRIELICDLADKALDLAYLAVSTIFLRGRLTIGWRDSFRGPGFVWRRCLQS